MNPMMIAQLSTVDVPAITDTVSEPVTGHQEVSEADVKTEVAEIETNDIQIDEIEHINNEPTAKRKSPIKIITPVAPQLGKRLILSDHKNSTTLFRKSNRAILLDCQLQVCLRSMFYHC